MAVFNDFKTKCFSSEEYGYVDALINQCVNNENVKTFLHFAILDPEDIANILGDLTPSTHPFYTALSSYFFSKTTDPSITGTNEEKWEKYKKLFPDDIETAAGELIYVLRNAPNNLTFDNYKAQNASYVAARLDEKTPSWQFYIQLGTALSKRASKLYDGWQALFNSYSGEEQKAVGELLNYIQGITPKYIDFLAMGITGATDILKGYYADTLYIQDIAKTFRYKVLSLLDEGVPEDMLEDKVVNSYAPELQSGISEFIKTLKADSIVTSLADFQSISLTPGPVTLSPAQPASSQSVGIASSQMTIGMALVLKVNNKDVVYYKVTNITPGSAVSGLASVINNISTGEWAPLTASVSNADTMALSGPSAFMLSGFTNNYFPYLQSVIANLKDGHVLYRSYAASLYNKAGQYINEGRVKREVKGRLQATVAGTTNLEGYHVRITDIDDPLHPAELGTVRTDKEGKFSLFYFVDNDSVSSKKVMAEVLDGGNTAVLISSDRDVNIYADAANGTFEGGTAPAYNEWNLVKGIFIEVQEGEQLGGEQLAGLDSTADGWYRYPVSTNTIVPIESAINEYVMDSEETLFSTQEFVSGKKYIVRLEAVFNSLSGYLSFYFGTEGSYAVPPLNNYLFFEQEVTYAGPASISDDDGNAYFQSITFTGRLVTIKNVSIREAISVPLEGSFSPSFHLNAAGPGDDYVFKGASDVAMEANKDYELSAYLYFSKSVAFKPDHLSLLNSGLYLRPDNVAFNDLKEVTALNDYYNTQYITGGITSSRERSYTGNWYRIRTRFNSGANTSCKPGLYMKGAAFASGFYFSIDRLELKPAPADHKEFLLDSGSYELTLLLDPKETALTAGNQVEADSTHAQKTNLVPVYPEAGDIFILDINNSGTVSYKATDASVAGVTAGLTNAIQAETADLDISVSQQADSTHKHTLHITPQDIRSGARYVLTKSMKNLFTDGDNGTFENSSDPGSYPPSDWGLTGNVHRTGSVGYRGTASLLHSNNFSTGKNLAFTANTSIKVKRNTRYRISAYIRRTGGVIGETGKVEGYFLPKGYIREQLSALSVYSLNQPEGNVFKLTESVFDSGSNDALQFQFFVELSNDASFSGEVAIDEVRMEEYPEKVSTVAYTAPSGATLTAVLNGLTASINEASAGMDVTIDQYAGPEQKQQITVTPVNIKPGAQFVLEINGKNGVSYTAGPSDTASNVASGLVAAIRAASGGWTAVYAEVVSNAVQVTGKREDETFYLSQRRGEWSDVDVTAGASYLTVTGKVNDQPFTVSQQGGKWKAVSATDMGNHVEVTADEDNNPFTITVEVVKASEKTIPLSYILENAGLMLPAEVAEALHEKGIRTIADINDLGGLKNNLDGHLKIEEVQIADSGNAKRYRVTVLRADKGDVYRLLINGHSPLTYVAESSNIREIIGGLTDLITDASGDWNNVTPSFDPANPYFELAYNSNGTDFDLSQELLAESYEVKKLDALASLYTVANGLGFTDQKTFEIMEELVVAGYDSTLAITEVPQSVFVKDLYRIAGDFNAARMYQLAAIRKSLTQELAVGYAGGVFKSAGTDAGALTKISSAVGESCDCEDCETMVSPMAYLTDLMNYVLRNLKKGNAASGYGDLTIQGLENYFYQNFIELPASCDDIRNTVCQVRIAIEVLRRYVAVHAPDEERRKLLDKGLQQYAFSAYQYLLQGIGISYQELRLAKSEERRRKLAERLGISYEDHPDFADKLLADPQVVSMESWTDYMRKFQSPLLFLIEYLYSELESRSVDFASFKLKNASELKSDLLGMSVAGNFKTELANIIRSEALRVKAALQGATLSNYTADEELWAKFVYDISKKFSWHFRPAFEVIAAEMQKKDFVFKFGKLNIAQNNEHTFNDFISYSIPGLISFLQSLNGDGTKGDFWMVFAGALKAMVEDNSLSERDLEELFGLTDTSRDIFSDGAKIEDPFNTLQRWNISGIEWGKNTDRNGYIYLEMDEANKAVHFYKDSLKGIDNKVAVAIFDPQTNKFIISEFNNGGLTGELILDRLYENTLFYISAVPLYLSWKLDGLRKQWLKADGISQAPVVDPDLVGPADIVYPYEITETIEEAWKAIDLWHFRKEELDSKYDEVKGIKEGNDDAYNKLATTGTGTGNVKKPSGIAADGSGSLYVSDRDNNRIQKMDMSGVWSIVSGLGSLSHPHGIFFHEDKLYIADTDNNRIQVKDLTGSDPVISIGGTSSGNSLGLFSGPKGVTVDEDLNLYVADTGNSRIQRFGLPLKDMYYKQEARIDIETVVNEVMPDHKTVYVIPKKVSTGDVLVLSMNGDADKLIYFVTDSAVAAVAAGLTKAFRMKESAVWTSVVAEDRKDHVKVWSPSTDNDFQLVHDTSVAFTSDSFFASRKGDIYYSDQENNRVLRLDRDLHVLRSYGKAHRYTEALAAYYKFNEAKTGMTALASLLDDSQPKRKYKVTPQNPVKGAAYRVHINSTWVSYSAEEASISLITKKLAGLINGSAVNTTVTATDQSSYIEIEANSAGNNFTLETEVRNAAADFSQGGNLHNGHYYGSPSFRSDGTMNEYVYLNGSTDYITIPSSADLDGSTIYYRTLELWFRPESFSGYNFIYRHGGGRFRLDCLHI